MRSIRRFLIIVLLATVTLVNFLAALHGYRSSMSAAEALFDQQLLQIARIFSDQPNSVQEPPAAGSSTAIVYQIWEEGRLIDRAVGAPTDALAPFSTGFHEVNFRQARWRVAVLAESGGRWVQVAQRIDNRFTLAENVISQSVLPLVLSVPVIGVLIWLIVSWGLLPLQQLARQLQQKQPEDLSPIRNVADTTELRQLVVSVNDLLVRLHGALERESRFASNAAHELRTPLSVLKVHLYNLRNENGQDAKALAELEHGIDRLSHLIEQIFALHISSQDHRNLVLKPLNLAVLCREEIGDHFSLFSLKHLEIELITEEAVTITANAQSLRVMLGNLLTNASKYTPTGGKVCVSITKKSDAVVLKVEDSGPGIPPAERERVFERFYRVGGDHHASGEIGCGLGLSIVYQIVESHGAHISLGQSMRLGGLCVAIQFPVGTC